MRRTRNDGTGQSRLYRGEWSSRWLRATRSLAAVYLTDRLGTLVEPIFFVAFSVMVLAEIFESVGNAPARPTWAQRVGRLGSGARAKPASLKCARWHRSAGRPTR